mgnify:FL=1|jgi:hypothetical protein
MRPYIEDREGNKYEFRRLTRREKLNLVKNAREIEEASDDKKIELTDELLYTILQTVSSVDHEKFEDILDYNEEIYGFEQVIELETAIISWVFTQAGGETIKVHPYLEEMKKKEELEKKEEVEQPTTPIQYDSIEI